MKIIVDAMGGDNAPKAPVEGALKAVERYGCEALIVGNEREIAALFPENCTGISVVGASEVIENEEKATAAVRGKKDSSMSVALNMLAAGQGDAVVSAGSTGALLTGATLIVKRVRGVRRGALASLLPAKGCKVMLLDSGANTECTPEYLLQFAFLGSIYMNKVCGIENPRVALLSNGTEEGKGAPLQKEAFVLLRQAADEGRINFIGNVEGRDLLSGCTDVLVCDGFAGNIALKTLEGTAEMLMGEIKGIFMKNALTKLCAAGVMHGFKALRATMDYKKIGGAPFLGISKPVIKAHGSSNGEAFCAAIGQAIDFAKSGVTEAVCDNISYMTAKKE